MTGADRLDSSMLLDKRYRSECHMNGIKVVFPSANRYDALLKQRHIQVWSRVSTTSACERRVNFFSYSVVQSI